MSRSTFDRVFFVALGTVVTFSVVVAVTNWDWFPTDDWSHVASIPPTALNYAALLLPWLTLLTYVVTRRWRWGADAPPVRDSDGSDETGR